MQYAPVAVFHSAKPVQANLDGTAPLPSSSLPPSLSALAAEERVYMRHRSFSPVILFASFAYSGHFMLNWLIFTAEDAGEDNATVFVKNLNFMTTEDDLHQLFSPVGPVRYRMLPLIIPSIFELLLFVLQFVIHRLVGRQLSSIIRSFFVFSIVNHTQL